MSTRDTGTEQLIRDTAKHLFFAEGKLHATTQEIADAAGVNRTLVNYYFRSRDILFDQVFNEAQEVFSSTLDEVFESSMPFKEKIRNLINVFIEETTQYPYRQLFIITEMNRDLVLYSKRSRVNKVKSFIEEIQLEMDNGELRKMDPRQFIINLFSLMAHPLITAPLQQAIFGMNDDEYAKLMEERKELIFETIFR
ncbi:DNA-binding transcriptional regulator, AcrR family [Pedobacter steynii]|uniref:DNA-binding transcriptional regulator, AcrR family n=1 Tax=Pedobacter steynii TaxID=430522 RepID=A0A1G9T571_9SPHI|nr:TetR/AcrR family transcriptional regulator [Pedobacter steynii]NQX37236.1 TetR/AcrR family transcriptional regulator [Pedobacter steynii]SDM42831.1 DNA-binding transcriptional regulator, AcrR family [Pedobacter steynii]